MIFSEPARREERNVDRTQAAASRPPLSIVMPVYNVERYIAQAIRSILLQTWRNFELLVVDDGSTDDSVAILSSACGHDPRVRILAQNNLGLSAARNLGLRCSRGEFVYFFDSDDILDIDAIRVCMEEIDKKNLDLVAFSGSVFPDNIAHKALAATYSKPDILEPQTGAALLATLESASAFSPSPCLYVFSHSLASLSELRFDEGFLHEDEGFTPVLFCLSRRAVSLSMPLFQRRMRANSITTSPPSPRNIAGLIRASRKLFDFAREHGGKLPKSAKLALRRRLRVLLRSALVKGVELADPPDFVELVRDSFSLRELVTVDAVIAAYVALGPARHLAKVMLKQIGKRSRKS